MGRHTMLRLLPRPCWWLLLRVLVRQIRDHADPETMKVGWGAWAVLFFFWVLKKAVKGTPERRKKVSDPLVMPDHTPLCTHSRSLGPLASRPPS